jgi:HAD superfamily hydrolase (TIGR01509 family)
MRAELGIDIGLEEGVGWLVDTFIARITELELKPGLSELVEAASARGLGLAVASSSTRALVDATLERFALRPRFQAVVSGDMVERLKPAPDIFLCAAELLGVEPAACVVLEDSIAGVRAAVAAGMPVIAVPELDGLAFAELTPHVLGDLHQARVLLGLCGRL